MPQFRTRINLAKSDFQLGHGQQMMCVGSCFAQHIGNFLEKYKFKTLVNPFGILYNPLSICKNLRRALDGQAWEKEDLVLHNELWQSFDHHSAFSSLDTESCLQNINQALKDSSQTLRSGDCLIITLGTSFVYTLKSTGKVVANCHKFPADHFERRMLKVDEIVVAFDHFINQLRAANPGIHLVFTLSPIRHLKDGMVENQKSKARLLIAIHQLCEKYSFAHYFPAYEIMMDELRDYRFYADDLLHPSSLAIEYIQNQFKEAFIKKESQELITRIDKIVQASGHRPFNPSGKQHQEFARKQINKISDLVSRYPHLDFARERAIFEQQLKEA